MLTIGIETSCDETAVALTEGRRVLASCVTSSVHLHARYGGVVPEIASRHHVEYITYVLEEALARAGRRLKDVMLVAVTEGPGLVGALLVGISAAKALSYALKVPLVGVNHVLAHLYSIFLGPQKRPSFPFVGLVVSGGHTSLYLCRDFDRIRLLGQTQDDAVGEAYDKVAKVLRLGFPGGPVIERMAARARSGHGISFPRTFLGKGSLDFSFSGVKTAVLYYARDAGGGSRHPGRRLDRGLVCDICDAFQEAVLEVVAKKTVEACVRHGIGEVVAGGGVSANRALRRRLTEEGARRGVRAYFPEFAYCTDNAAMIAFLGEALYRKGYRSDLSMTADARLEAHRTRRRTL